MKSLNEPYHHDEFHKTLVGLAGVTASSCLLDAGCGIGRSLRPAAKIAKTVVGIDCNEKFLARARGILADSVGAGRVHLLKADLDQGGIPFPDGQFDNIICQNVLECISDKVAFIHECHRVLKPQGTALFGHHDFCGVMLNSATPLLTRKIIASYADEQQDWMTASDGEIGRKLPGFLRASKFTSMTTETRQFVEFSFDEATYARSYCGQAGDSAGRAGIAKSDLDEWAKDLTQLDLCGAFYFSIPWIYVRATKSA